MVEIFATATGFGLCLKDKIIGDDRAFCYHNDTITDENRVTVKIAVLCFIDKLDAVAYADIFVDDCLFDNAVLSNDRGGRMGGPFCL